MDDDQILMRGGTEEDIAKYAEQNGADHVPGEKWAYSTDEEYFNCEEEYDTKELAIEAVKKDVEIEEGSTVWIGKAVKIDKNYLIMNGIASIDADNMCEALGNEVGEIADDWHSVVEPHTDKMSEMIADYIMEHCPPHFGAIEDIFEITK